MVYYRSLLLTVVFAFGFAACGGDEPALPTGQVTRAPRGDLPPPIGSAPGDDGEVTRPTETTSFELAAPPVPPGAFVVPLDALLVNRTTGESRVVSSSGPTGGPAAPLDVTAGSYTLTFLDDNGIPSAVTQTVELVAGQPHRLAVGAVWVAPESAAFDSRTDTSALAYRIFSGAGTLKEVVASLNAFIVVPAAPLAWAARGINGDAEPVTLDAGTGVLRAQWGSLLVRKRALQEVTLQTARGVVLIPAAVDGIEYLLPATTQAQGCMVYLGIVDRLETRTITLCTDVQPHAILDAR